MSEKHKVKSEQMTAARALVKTKNLMGRRGNSPIVLELVISTEPTIVKDCMFIEFDFHIQIAGSKGSWS